MAINVGKKFEKNIQSSIPDYVLTYRLPDPAQSFGKSSMTRFSRKNPFDYLLWNPQSKRLYALELKTVSGKSISFERTKEEHGEIHKFQIDGLQSWSKFEGVIAGFIIEFREIEKTIFIGIEDFLKLISVIDKKSFTLNDIVNNNIQHFVIEQRKKKTNYSYDMEAFLKSDIDQ